MKPTLPEPDFHQATIYGYSHGYSAESVQSLIDEAYKAGMADAQTVSVETLQRWKDRVNTLAVLSLKAERRDVAIGLKTEMRDAIDDAVLPKQEKPCK